MGRDQQWNGDILAKMVRNDLNFHAKENFFQNDENLAKSELWLNFLFVWSLDFNNRESIPDHFREKYIFVGVVLAKC